MTRNKQAWIKFLMTRVVGLVLDGLVLAAAFWSAVLLRFDFHAPRWGWKGVAASFVSAAFVFILSLIACGCYRLAWRRFSLRDLPRYLGAALLACLALTFLRYETPLDEFIHLRPPYSVTLIFSVLAALGVIGWRIAWRGLARIFVRERDLLERDVRTMDPSVAIDFLQGKTVMVTGAGGSIGSELVRQVALAAPKLLLLVERGENALYEIDRELRQKGTTVPFKPLMVDINDLERMEDVFNFYRPDIVLHAAAYKHVPMVEANPREGERNNTVATKNLGILAKKYGVKRFVMISTDKAVNPVSVMGKTKLAAEKEIMALNEREGEKVKDEGEGERRTDKFFVSADAGDNKKANLHRSPSPLSFTSFCAVRFGNVLGSSGSVVPLFKEQIEKKLPLTVTHPDMKRYFMTVEEAVGLVLQAASRKEQAIYTLDMGEPVKIVDLAEQMIRQAGYKPHVDIPIVFTGIRPGEKLFEEIDVSEKSCYRTDMAKIYITK